MAAGILSQDILGICLLMVEGDTNASLGNVITAVESFQQERNRHFGISIDDFRMLFWGLMFFEIGIKDDFPDNSWLQKFKLHEIIPEILEFHDAAFNDEGESWTPYEAGPACDECEPWNTGCWFGYSEEEYRSKSAQKLAMQEFFANKERHDSAEVMNFLALHGLDKNLLDHCSRQGESS
jgi:hypothetical protein